MLTKMIRLVAAAGVMAAIVALGSSGALRHAGAIPAGASVPSALELADHGLSTVSGLDDEGNYALIDPIGPGGVKTTEAADEVFASTLQGGKYTAWRSYRDPFAPQPGPPQTGHPYQPGGGSSNGGGAR